MSKEAMKLALEALKEAQTNNDGPEYWDRNKNAIKALEEALAKQEQCKYPKCDYPCMNLPDCQEQDEPVAWYYKIDETKGISFYRDNDLSKPWQPLYTTP